MMFPVNTNSEDTDTSLYLESTIAEIILQESLLIDEAVQFEIKRKKVQEIIEQLQQLAQNIELTIENVEGDELTIKIEGSENTLQTLQDLLTSDKLTQISGVTVKQFKLVKTHPFQLEDLAEQIDENDPQFLLIERIMSQGGNDQDFREANLSGAILCNANLILADLREANLMGTDLSGANLMGADLSGADLLGANLTGANLMGANLTEANLTGADLGDAILQEADLCWADLSEVNLIGADLSQANLKGAILTDSLLSHTNLNEANLSEAILNRSILSKTNLSGSILSQTDLTNAYFSGGNVSETSLENINVTEGEFRDNQEINES
ncbi:rfrA family pentapeptide repeat [Crocosphaera subtropica ATCC 51142]|uniref:RfrA family pentapeptide repeat n=1 Tax=Crocosphaera subtropica (strain ATCC 51142 / BH68) TaxID=43989 RepID=B1X1I5_CROS5|nr:pentapeptide repeat-containing protein [Crocosphaera subtropica]ACB51414.1 rfrA family pentapeptide repeat [Crocosphaera subtropica ATCC 51142]